MEELIKRIPVQLEVKQFKIIFDYETVKGHRRTQKRKLEAIDTEMAKGFFKSWAKNSRTISNAKILDIVEIVDTKRILEL